MAGNYDLGYRKDESETSKGHYVRYSFSVNDFPTTSTWQFQTLYHTICYSVPTSWKILLKGSSNSYSLTLSREDGLRKPVDVHVWISSFDIHHRRLSPPKVFAKWRLLPGDEIHGRSNEIISTEEVRILEKQMLNVELSVLVCSCHKKVSSKVDIDSEMNKLHLSKM